MDDGGDKALQRGVTRVLLLRPLCGAAHLAEKLLHLAGLGDKCLRPLLHRPLHHLSLTEGGHQYRPRPCGHGRQPVQQAEAVKLRQDHIHYDQLRTFPRNDAPRFRAVADASRHLKISRGFDHLPQHHAKALVSVHQYDLHVILHSLPSPFCY